MENDLSRSNVLLQFDEEGNVASDSDETLLKNEVGTDYSLDFQGEKAVLLTLLNGGMLQYLNETTEDDICHYGVF